MTMFKLSRYVLASILLLLSVGSIAQALTLSVDCDSKEGPTNFKEGFTSIGAALKVRQGTLSSVPNTINVAGACHVSIHVGTDNVTSTAITNNTQQGILQTWAGP